MKLFPLFSKTYQDLQTQLQNYPQSNFAAIRKHDIHTGIDIYTDAHSPVRAIEDGVVVAMENFTGASVDSPWWNETQCLVIKSTSGFILYGEIKINQVIKLGDKISAGDIIGIIIPVLKKDKGLNPIYMLHLELYKAGPFGIVWNLGEKQPENLLNPQVLF